MAEPWTALYTNALQANPSELLAIINVACDAMHNRLYALLWRDEAGFRSERRALYLGLADLHVLRLSRQASLRVTRA
jgi:hypothetical protein